MQETEQDELCDLGAWLGRRQAFSAVASRCSAADAECLRTIRERKLYRVRGVSWEQFCRDSIGISRSLADQLIRELDEFGPAYFHLAGVARITPETFRLIAGSVSEDGVTLGEEKIRFAPENATRIAQAVEALRSQADVTRPLELENDVEGRVAHAQKAFTSALTELERVSTLPRDRIERVNLRATIDLGIQRLQQLTGIVPV